eukprot:XP_014062378.1 PREDICTED: very long-chain specific acyl-CoA dehydrogenase, mitochondrial-like [Salmo salar]
MVVVLSRYKGVLFPESGPSLSAQHEKMLCENWYSDTGRPVRGLCRTSRLRSRNAEQIFKNPRAISTAAVENGGAVSPPALGF